MFKQKKETGIKENIIRTFFYLIMGVMLLISLTAWYINEEAIERVKENDLKNEHAILTNILIPSLFVNNTTDIRKTLNLASNTNKMFAVIDQNNNIFLPDYEKSSLISAVNKQNIINKCLHNYFFHKTINNKTYFIYCSPLKNKTLNYVNKNFGLLFSFSDLQSFYFSKLFFYFICLSISVLLLTFFWFNKTLNGKLLKPLIVLEKSMRQSENKSLLTDRFEKNTDLTSIKEVRAIKNAFEKVVNDLHEENKKRLESEKKVILVDLSAAVAHDIRSPIMAINSMLHNLSSKISSRERQEMEQAIRSICDIANNILIRYKDKDGAANATATIMDDGNQPRHILVSSIVDIIASQKRYEWQNNPCDFSVDIYDDAKTKWIFASPNNLKRALSNLLNNAYEALEGQRKIELSLKFENNQLICTIKDTGKGMDQHQINAAIHGKSFKKDGNGLGLIGAKKMIEIMGGSLTIDSDINQGTKMALVFSYLATPPWLPEKIILNVKHNAILDDDFSVHNLWRNITNMLEVSAKHFTNPEKFSIWFESLPNKQDVILIFDYELNQEKITGLDLLEAINPGQRGYLMTSHAEEILIQQRCEKAGIWLIPKVIFEHISVDNQ